MPRWQQLYSFEVLSVKAASAHGPVHAASRRVDWVVLGLRVKCQAARRRFYDRRTMTVMSKAWQNRFHLPLTLHTAEIPQCNCGIAKFNPTGVSQDSPGCRAAATLGSERHETP